MKSCFCLSAPALALALALTGCSGTSSGSDVQGKSSGATPGTGTPSGGSGSAHDALFDTPADADVTSGSIYGLWGGAMKDLSITFDSRMRLDPSKVMFATKCVRDDGTASATVGVTAAARVDAEQIAILESKNDEKKTGDITCRANARPGTTKRCDTENDAFRHDCFVLDGTQLMVYGASSLDKAALTKISD